MRIGTSNFDETNSRFDQTPSPQALQRVELIKIVFAANTIEFMGFGGFT